MSEQISEFYSVADNINNTGTIPTNTKLISDKYDKLYSIFRQYISKLLICVEITMFKQLKKSNMSINLKYNSCYRIVNTLLSTYFNDTYHRIHTECFECQYFDMMSEIINETKLHILHRIIYITIDFYNGIDRTKLRIDTPENYLNDFADQFDLVFKAMKTSIYGNLAKKIDIPFDKYVKEYNPFEIKLDINDFDEND